MRKINFQDFRVGQVYYIDSRNEERSMKHTGVFIKYLNFVNGRPSLAEFWNITNIPKSIGWVSERHGDGIRNAAWNFYIPTKEQIIKQRENRTLTLVLQQITGDEHFISSINI